MVGERFVRMAGALGCGCAALLASALLATTLLATTAVGAPAADGAIAPPAFRPPLSDACRGYAVPDDEVAAVPAEDAAPAGWPGWDADADGVFTLAVFGDSLADGYWGGVYRALARQDRFEILRHARNATGLSRSDYFDWLTALEEHLATAPIDAALISMGANDHQSIYLGDRAYLHYGHDGWDEAYRARVLAMMSRLEDAGIPTFWVGLPVVRDDTRVEAARRLNRLYADAAEEAGATFIPLWTLTAGESGDFASYLPDEDGRSRRMRADDGIHFTSRGYSMIADHLMAIMDAELSLFDPATVP